MPQSRGLLRLAALCGMGALVSAGGGGAKGEAGLVQWNGASGFSPLALPLPLPATPGDTLIVTTTADAPCAVGDNLGTDYKPVAVDPLRGVGSLSNAQGNIWFGNVADAAQGQVEVFLDCNPSGGSAQLVVLEYSGLDPTSTLDAQAGSASTDASSSPTQYFLMDSGFLTTDTGNELLLGWAVASGWGVYRPGNLSLRVAFNDALVEDGVTGGAGTFNATAESWDPSWMMQLAAFRIAADAGSGDADGGVLDAGPVQLGSVIRYIQASAGVASAGHLRIPFAAPSQRGDTIIVAALTSGSSTNCEIHDNAKNDYLLAGIETDGAGALGANQLRLWYAKDIDAGAARIEVMAPNCSQQVALYVLEYAGLDRTSPFDSEVGVASSSAAPLNSGTTVTATDDELLIGVAFTGEQGQPPTPGSGFARRLGFFGALVEDRLSGPKGAYSATATAVPGTSGWMMKVAAFKAAPAADAGSTDAGVSDGGVPDGGLLDGGPVDSGFSDGGASDASVSDAGLLDSGPTDSGPTDGETGASDSGSFGAPADSARALTYLAGPCGCSQGGLGALVWLLAVVLSRRSRSRGR